jgi:hypothetical protein
MSPVGRVGQIGQVGRLGRDIKPIGSWRFNPKTNQVALAAGSAAPRLEVWKLENFLPAPNASR